MPLGLSPLDTFTITRYLGSTRGAVSETPGDIWGISSELKSLAVTELAGMKKPRRSGAVDRSAGGWIATTPRPAFPLAGLVWLSALGASGSPAFSITTGF